MSIKITISEHLNSSGNIILDQVLTLLCRHHTAQCEWQKEKVQRVRVLLGLEMNLIIATCQQTFS